MKGNEVFKLGIFMEIPLIIAAAVIISITGGSFDTLVVKGSLAAHTILGVGLAVIIQGTSALIYKTIPSFREIHQNITIPVLGSMKLWQIIVIAFVSGTGEELMFRGVLQPKLGIVVSNIIFALLHMGTNRKLFTYALYTFVIGMVLGYIYKITGSIYPCIISHIGVNFLAGIMVKKGYIYK